MGKRSGSGIVCHRTALVNALSRALSERVMLLDFTIGRKGLIGYLKALAGSNIVKIVPAADGAGVSQTIGKRLKVACGTSTSYLEDMAWIGDKTPLTVCEVRVSPHRNVTPNIGGLELAEALNRVLPFTAKEDNRPVLQCVLFKAGEGKLSLVSADGYRLAVVSLDFEGVGQSLILRDDLKGIANALRRAHRVKVSFEKSSDSLEQHDLIVDTEITRYTWLSLDGEFPDYEKLIPDKPVITAHLDTVEAARAITSLKALSDNKEYPIDLHLNGGITLSSPDEKGTVSIPADIEGGEGNVRIAGAYLTEALKACGGMADFKVTDSSSPVLFTVDGYQLVVMPMYAGDNQKPEDTTETAEPETVEQDTEPETPETETEPDTGQAEAESGTPEPEKVEAETIANTGKVKRSRRKEPVAV